jgi:hypothetical protein
LPLLSNAPIHDYSGYDSVSVPVETIHWYWVVGGSSQLGASKTIDWFFTIYSDTYVKSRAQRSTRIEVDSVLNKKIA